MYVNMTENPSELQWVKIKSLRSSIFIAVLHLSVTLMVIL